MPKLLLCLFFLIISPLLEAEERDSRAPLHFCNSHWPPYSYGDKRAQPIGGYAIDFMREISKRIDHPIRLSILPWLRCLTMNKKGQLDGIMLLTANEDRRRFLYLTEPLLHDANLLWYLNDNQHVADRTSFEELQGLRIGIVEGFNYGEAFAEATEQLKLAVQTAPTVYTNFVKLERGWIDVFLVNRVVADFTLLSRPELKERLVVRKGPFEPVGFRVGLSHAGKAANMLDQFNSAIEAMTREGVVTTILQYPPLVLQVVPTN
ncbi:substrate-binding periplasmic protein [Marinobacter alexandrii]|uniref:substrate-binding periplasmic protein n=1 Tax=Marinobacter alexandrii TaxID=2570351 RepID=UPI00326795B0